MPLKTKILNLMGQVFHVGIDVHKESWKVKVRSNHSVIKSLLIIKGSDDPAYFQEPLLLLTNLEN